MHKKKGGSIASDAVSSLVTKQTYDDMNTRFSNNVPSCKQGGSISSSMATNAVSKATFDQLNTMFSNKLGGCGCSAAKSAQGKAGGSVDAMKTLLGSNTKQAFNNMTGGNVMSSIPQLLAADASLAMTVKNRQRGGAFAKASAKPKKCGKTHNIITHKGGSSSSAVEVDVSPKINVSDYAFTPRTIPNATAIDILASESVASIPLMQKITMYGQVTPLNKAAFSFSQPTDINPMQPTQGSVISGVSSGGGRKGTGTIVVSKKPCSASKSKAPKRSTAATPKKKNTVK